MRSRLAVLVSGSGSNLKALIEFLDRAGERASCEVAIVLSNRADAPALDVAREHGIPARSFAATGHGEELDDLLRESRIDLVVLAGYLKKIPASVVAAYSGRILNVHPGRLPAHGGPGMYGMRVHEAVIAAGERETGVTVHLVNDEYDRGPIVAQWRIPVRPDDDANSLALRVLEMEHIIFPRIVDLVAALQQNPGGDTGTRGSRERAESAEAAH